MTVGELRRLLSVLPNEIEIKAYVPEKLPNSEVVMHARYELVYCQREGEGPVKLYCIKPTRMPDWAPEGLAEAA